MKIASRLLRLTPAAALALLLASPTWLAAQAPPAGATFKCTDGTYSTAATARGACSRHGGVAESLRAPAAERAPAPAPANEPAGRTAAAGRNAAPTAATPAGAPANATAICKDGTYSTSQHRGGTCSRHGGVQSWLRQVPD